MRFRLFFHVIRPGCLIAAICTTALLTFAGESINITVHSGDKQTYKGLGINMIIESCKDYLDMPEASRREMLALLWYDAQSGGMGMKYLRTWLHSWRSTDDYVAAYALALKEITALQPDLHVLLCPQGPVRDPRDYGGHYAHKILELKRDYHFNIQYTGICNEPNGSMNITPNLAGDVVAAFRDSLDALDYLDASDPNSLHNVKIIAPECSNTDDLAAQYLESIMNNEKAMQGLYAFAIHSYNMCMRPDWRDMLEPYGKALWQTESSNTLQPENFNDSGKAAEGVARFLNDMNLGVEVWMYWIAHHRWTDADNGSIMISTNPITGEYRPFLKFYYFRHIVRTFDEGAVFRTSSSDVGDDMFPQWLTNWYGGKPPVNVAAAVNPDGTWAMAVVNLSGVPNRGEATFWAATDFDVTFRVEDLAGSGEKTFKVWRCNAGTRANEDLETITMTDGVVTVTTHPCELVCLRPEFNTGFLPVPDFSFTPQTSACGSCGAGFGLAFLPPIGSRLALAVRRRKIRRKRAEAERKGAHDAANA